MLRLNSRRLRRAALTLAIAAFFPLIGNASEPSPSAAPIDAVGVHTDAIATLGPAIVPITDFPDTATMQSTCSYPHVEPHVMCSWGTHDSTPTARIDVRSQSIASEPVERVASLSETTVARAPVSAATSALLGAAGVRVQQMVEPFAMVGPGLAEALGDLDPFLAWCDEWSKANPSQQELEETQAVAPEDSLAMSDLQVAVRVDSAPVIVEPLVSLDSMLADMATNDAGDLSRNYVETFRNYVETFRGSVLPSNHAEPTVSEVIVREEAAIEITKLNPLVGSGPMIATIREAYLPYDLSASDLQLWSVFPTSTRPFCVRAVNGLANDMSKQSSLWPAAESAKEKNLEKANRHLDSIIQWAGSIGGDIQASAQEATVGFEMRLVGQKLAELVINGNRLASGAVASAAKSVARPISESAAQAPAKIAEVEPKVPTHWTSIELAGTNLLARAEAVAEIIAEFIAEIEPAVSTENSIATKFREEPLKR